MAAQAHATSGRRIGITGLLMGLVVGLLLPTAWGEVFSVEDYLGVSPQRRLFNRQGVYFEGLRQDEEAALAGDAADLGAFPAELEASESLSDGLEGVDDSLLGTPDGLVTE